MLFLTKIKCNFSISFQFQHFRALKAQLVSSVDVKNFIFIEFIYKFSVWIIRQMISIFFKMEQSSFFLKIFIFYINLYFI